MLVAASNFKTTTTNDAQELQKLVSCLACHYSPIRLHINVIAKGEGKEKARFIALHHDAFADFTLGPTMDIGVDSFDS